MFGGNTGWHFIVSQVTFSYRIEFRLLRCKETFDADYQNQLIIQAKIYANELEIRCGYVKKKEDNNKYD